jgi:hypothetical protein
MAQLPIGKFLKDRLTEYDPSFELRNGTGFESLFFKPIQFIVQPLQDDAAAIYTSQSFLRILLTDDPDAYSETDVDDLASNLFVFRREGALSSGSVRVYYNSVVDREYAAGGAIFQGSNGLSYTNPQPFAILASQMEAQLDDGLYYFDIPVESVDSGANTELPSDEIVTFAGDPEVVRVTNLQPISGGLDRETNINFINRVQQSIGVRDLVAGKGFRAILFENFQNNLLEATPVGFGDGEMMRDIVYNTHIGGKVDGWVKTSRVTVGAKNFIGVLTDTTRQTFASKNVQLTGTAWGFVGNRNVDRSNNKLPIVKEIKPSFSAEYTSTVNFSTPVNLGIAQYVKIAINNDVKNIKISGAVPSATTRNEIVNLINAAFGYNVAFASGPSIKIKSPIQGIDSEVIISNPDIGISAINIVFGLPVGTAPHIFLGSGPVTFVDGVHYEFDEPFGNVRRIVGPTILGTQSTGQTTLDTFQFDDSTPSIFINIQERDIISITSGPDAGDYRILKKISDNQLIVDKKFTASNTGLNYSISRTGIKSGETVYVQYYYNPLSIDIGKLVALDPYGRLRSVRPGREDFTITDLALLRITSIEEIDPLTGEPTGLILDGSAGYGQGGYGKGPYGVGVGADWRLIVNIPEHRFSMFEDSYIVLNGSFEALSFRVNYEYVPEIESYHDFVRSPNERVLDGDILMKHFIPAYVSGVIRYKVASSNTNAPDNESLTALVKDYINKIPAGSELQFSDIIQFIARTCDPFDRYDLFIEPFKLSAVIYNTNGTTQVVTGTAKLTIPTFTPIYTTRPLSPRTSHWLADNIVLERME